jgi:hypothetical protein
VYLFFLGIILGMGLVLAQRSVAKTLQLRSIRKAHAVELEVQRRVNERLGISSWDTDAARTPVGPNGKFIARRHP